MYDDVDLEDIECRLYSQIYHIENDVNIPSESNVTAFDNDKVHNSNRYFFKEHISVQPEFIPLEEESRNNSDKTYSSVHSVSVNPNFTDIVTEGNVGNQLQNNITVNQYNLPLIINPELSEVLDAERFFIPWTVKNKNLLDKKNKRKYKPKNKKRKIKNIPRNIVYNTRSQTRANIQRNNANQIVYISDESENECVIVNEKCNKTMTSIEQPNVSEDLQYESDDDDIIYIPPPPVEVINVDGDNEEEQIESVPERTISDIVETAPIPTDTIGSSNKSNCRSSGPIELSNTSESCTFNDFLDNSGVENGTHKFNFSLHGSDFNNEGDFLRPPNPIDYCETESSCSTNEFNKENNSLKTIVFNEVDFPKEDIFSDKNLEGFSTYITPKKSSTSTKSKVTSKTSKVANKSVNEDESSLSSSESDYEPSSRNYKVDEQFNKKLPTLSPMQCDKMVTLNTKTSKRKSVKTTRDNRPKATSSTRKGAVKRKSNALEDTESLTDTDEEQPELIRKKLPKKKKKLCTKKKHYSEEPNRNINMESQNKSSENDKDADVGSSSNAGEIVEISDSEKRTKRKTKNSLQREEYAKESNDEISDQANNINKEDCMKSINENTENINSDTSNTSHKKKRKKKKSSSSENSVKDTNITDTKENALSNRNNIASDSNERCTSSLVVPDVLQEQENLVLSTKQIENKSDFDKTVSKEELPRTEETESNDEIIVVDEVISHISDANVVCIEIVESSDSEYDFKKLRDVGQDIELANCTAGRKELSDDDIRFHVKNKNLCEDYSKFNVEQVQSTQSDDPQVWKILSKDRLMFLNPNNAKGPRCNRCRQFGHIAVRCTEKPDPPKCTLCGSSDHQEPRCPNKRCTQCGNEGDYSTTFCWKCVKFRNSICRICNMKGHIAKTCPDLWRRYHLTTQEGPIVICREPQLKPRDELWCSGCAGQGHLEHECNYYNREYPPTSPCIISYEDVLCHEDGNKLPIATPLPLPSPPVWNVQGQNNFYRNAAPFLNIPSTSQSAPYNNPIFIPQLMPIPNLNQILPVPTVIAPNEIMAPDDNLNANFANVPTKVLNPFSVLGKQQENVNKNIILDQMMSDYVNDSSGVDYVGCFDSEKGKVIHSHMIKYGANEFMKNDQRRVRQTMMSMPSHIVKQFLRKELDELENVVSRCDPKYLRKKLFKYDKISQSKKLLSWEIVKEKCFWYRILNMYIFGVHQFKDGKIHINYIKKYLSEPKQNKLDFHKRKSLLNAYNYVFDATRHVNVNYYKVIQQLISKYNEES